MIHYYIYYKVDPARHVAARDAALRVIAAVRAACALEGRLLRRSDDPDTWMEIYENVPEPTALDAAMAAAVAATDFDALLARGGRRIVERFVAVAE